MRLSCILSGGESRKRCYLVTVPDKWGKLQHARPERVWRETKICGQISVGHQTKCVPYFLKKHNNKKHTAVTEMVNELLFYGAFQVTKHFTLQSMIHTHTHKKKKKITARSAHVRLIINNEAQNHRPSDCWTRCLSQWSWSLLIKQGYIHASNFIILLSIKQTYRTFIGSSEVSFHLKNDLKNQINQ